MANHIQQAVSTAAKKPLTLKEQIKAMEGEIAKALPSVITPDRFTRMVMTTISANPTLQQCEAKSFLGAMMQAAQLGVEPNTPLGQAYIIPYKNHGVLQAQFQLGYKGLIDLAYRSGEISIVTAKEVCEHDEFTYEFGLEPKLIHKPALSERGRVIAYYALFKTKQGGFGFEIMSVEDVKAHAEKYSKAYGSGSSPWHTAFDEMAKKTVLKRVLKTAPLKSEFVRAVQQDETIKSGVFEDMTSAPDETKYGEDDIVYSADDLTVDEEG